MLWAASEVTVSYFYLQDQSCHIAQSNHSALLSKLEIQILHFPFMAAKIFEDNTTIVPLYFHCSIVNDDVITSWADGTEAAFQTKTITAAVCWRDTYKAYDEHLLQLCVKIIFYLKYNISKKAVKWSN